MSLATVLRRNLMVAIVAVGLLSGGFVYQQREFITGRRSSAEDMHESLSLNTSCPLVTCPSCPSPPPASPPSKLDSINYVRGKPTPSFRGKSSQVYLAAGSHTNPLADNLLPEVKYMTVWYAHNYLHPSNIPG